MAKICQWPQSRVFLDGLIRHLNGQRQFFLPLSPGVASTFSSSETEGAVGKKLPSDPCFHDASVAQNRGSHLRQPHPVKSTLSFGPHSHGFPCNTNDHSSGMIPSAITSQSSIAEAARVLFEQTPFSMHHLNNAFAAVKELIYITKHRTNHPSQFITPPLQTLQSLVFFSTPTSLSPLSYRSSSAVGMLQGLTEDMCRHLQDERPDRPCQPPLQESDDDSASSSSSSTTTGCSAVPSPSSSINASLSSCKVHGRVASTPSDGQIFPANDETEDTLCCSALPQEKRKDSPAPRVEMLVAHPQLRGYFRHSIMLVVQHSQHSTVGLVLNKVLLSEHKYVMPLRSVVRLVRVHDLYAVHLKDHPVLLGGPVISSRMERALTLLHHIPGVKNALQVGHANLWMNGDLDELKGKLDNNEASPEDVAVLCGFAGWGSHQIEGEISLGTWIVARSEEVTGDGIGNSTTLRASDSSSIAQPEKMVNNGTVERSENNTNSTERGIPTKVGISTEENREILGKYIFELIKTSSRQIPLTPSSESSFLTIDAESIIDSFSSGEESVKKVHERGYSGVEGFGGSDMPDLLQEAVSEEHEEREESMREESFADEGSKVSIEERMPLGGIAAWASIFQTFPGKMKEVCYI